MRSNPAQLHTAIKFKNFNSVISIVESGEDLNILWRGVTPVSCALYEKAYNIMEYLVRKGASVNIRTTDNKMEPPLFTACRLRQMEAVKILIQSPTVDINQRDLFNRSPLWAAARSSSFEIVKLLLDNGADANAAETPLECPLLQSLVRPQNDLRLSVGHLLIQRGCKVNFEGQGNPALALCFNRADAKTFCLFLKAGYETKKGEWFTAECLPADWKKNEQLCQWIASLPMGPRPLEHLATCCIRQTLVRTQSNIFPSHVSKLQIPNNLKSLILLED